MSRTRGSALLLGVIRERSRGEIAARVGVSRATVSYWASGTKRPIKVHAAVLELAFGIPTSAWQLVTGDNCGVCFKGGVKVTFADDAAAELEVLAARRGVSPAFVARELVLEGLARESGAAQRAKAQAEKQLLEAMPPIELTERKTA